VEHSKGQIRKAIESEPIHEWLLCLKKFLSLAKNLNQGASADFLPKSVKPFYDLCSGQIDVEQAININQRKS
jgi:hypothetical protein